ncbi:hypothetical protein AB0D30_19740 [Streptomyces sp. NPDC048409]|uniref:hypothetical protein n=1 Tax=Streptomyces sp. NPDC048409 TaxID=3154723 RepID=UPI00343F5021
MAGEGDHQRLDLDVIESMGRGLSSIKKAFDGIGKLENYSDDFGDEHLADKFKDFADNWEISREKLTGEVDALASIAKAAARAYEDIDHQLAEAIRSSQDPTEKGE